MRWITVATLFFASGTVAGCGGGQEALEKAPSETARPDGNASYDSGGSESADSGSADSSSADTPSAGEESAAEPMSTPAASAPPTRPVGDAVGARPAGPGGGDGFADADFSRRPAAEPLADVVAETREPRPADPPVIGQPVREPPRRPVPRTGLLTAGSLNDHANFDDYRDYLSESLQNATGELLRDFSIGQRVEIVVRDAAGVGIPDARVTVQIDGISGPLLETATRADGRTFFASGLDARDTAASQFTLMVTTPDGATAKQAVSLDQTPWEVELPGIDAKLPTRLDLALVIDTTGSMGDELEFLKAEIAGIAHAVQRRFPNVELRLALIVYRDDHDAYVVKSRDFMTSVSQFQQELSRHAAGGGGDYPEAMHVALEKAGQLEWRDDAAARVLFLVADAPPHDRHVGRTFEAVRKLREGGVAVYPLAGSGTRDQCEFLLRATAFMTRGQYLFLTDHSGVGNPHAKPHAPKYEVEPLDQLMIRMIASELAGRPVPASEVIATEENDGSTPPPPPESNQQSSHVHPQRGHAHAYSESASGGSVAVHTINSGPIWQATWFRIAVAAVLIAAIFSVDRWLRR